MIQERSISLSPRGYEDRLHPKEQPYLFQCDSRAGAGGSRSAVQLGHAVPERDRFWEGGLYHRTRRKKKAALTIIMRKYAGRHEFEFQEAQVAAVAVSRVGVTRLDGKQSGRADRPDSQGTSQSHQSPEAFPEFPVHPP
jgi:hypothetical protein